MRALLVGFTVSMSVPAFAGGMFLPGIGPRGQARAGAMVADANEPIALAYNPAGIAKLDGTHLQVGINLVDFWLTYHRAGVYEPTAYGHDYEGQDFPTTQDASNPSFGIVGFQAIPTLVATTDFGWSLPVRIALGFWAPQVYGNRAYAEQHKIAGAAELAPGPQRYDTVNQDVLAGMPSLAVSYSPTDWMDIGLRLTWGFVAFDADTVVWGVQNPAEAVERDSNVALSVSDTFVPGLALGALVRPTNHLEIGLSYSAPMPVDAVGTTQATVGSDVGLPGVVEVIEPTDAGHTRCAEGGTISALKACINLTLPQTASMGARWIWRSGSREQADVEVDVLWEDWTAGSTYDITIDGKSGTTGINLHPVELRHSANDVWSLRLGGAYHHSLDNDDILSFRAGAAYDTAAVADSWSRVDFDGAARITLAGGIGLTMGRFAIEVGGGIVLEPNRTVEICAPPYGPSSASPGCTGSGSESVVANRSFPDPSQPLEPASAQAESPFNAGEYASGYYLLNVGVRMAL